MGLTLSCRCPAGLIAALIMVLCSWSVGAAQEQVAQLARGPRFLLLAHGSSVPVEVDVSRTMILRRRVSLNRDGQTLAQLLAEITRQTGLRFAYNDESIETRRTVALKAESITVAAALTEILADAGVDVVLRSESQAALMRRRDAAQVGGVVGRVTDTKAGQGVAGAEVFLEGTPHRTLTASDGSYILRGVGPGNYTIIARRIGYRAQAAAVTVVDGETRTVDFALTEVALDLEELVSTVTGERAKRELGNVVGTIRADSLVALAPVTNMGDLISGRVPGVQVRLNTGLTGSSPRIRIRGINSLTVSNDPLLYVDGVRVENSSAAVFPQFLFGAGHLTGRLNDLNPEEIESIEIVKGPSAATLYGTDAANGVILVKTKRGLGGTTRWRTYSEFGLLEQPAQFPSNYYSWGRLAGSGAPTQCLLPLAATGGCTIDSVTSLSPLTDPATTPFETGHRTQVGAQVSGGTAALRYFAGAEYERELGYLRLPDTEIARLTTERGGQSIPFEQRRPNAARKASFRGSVNTTLGDRADLAITTGLVVSDANLPGNVVFENGLFGSGRRDLSDGWRAGIRPGDVFSVQTQEDVTRVTSSVSSSWRPTAWLSFRGTAGADFSSGSWDVLQRNGEGPAITPRVGRRLNDRSVISLYTVDLGSSLSAPLSPTLSSRTAVGVQYNRRLEVATSASAQGLPPGSHSITGASSIAASERRNESVVAGAYLEQTFGFRDALFVTGALRGDGASRFGEDFTLAAYPKASLSWIVAEARGPERRLVSGFRLRAAYGQSGVQPGPLAATARDSFFTTFIDGQMATGAVLAAIGNEDLKPERQREIEVGMDADLWEGRVHLEGTVYRKESRDALINRPLATSIGLRFRQENLGEVRNQGVEMLAQLRLLEGRQLAWSLTLNASVNQNRLLAVRDSVQPAASVGFDRQVPGYPIFGLWARPILGFADANSDGLLSASEVQLGDTAVFVGSSAPTRQLTAATDLSLFADRVRIGAQFDYRGGWTLADFSAANRCFASISNCREANDPSTPLADQARAVAWTQAFTPYGYFQSADYLRFRELSVTYLFGPAVARWFRVRGASVTLTGRNLALWSRFDGVDPETNSDPRPGGEIPIGNPTSPQTRYWLLRINLDL